MNEAIIITAQPTGSSICAPNFATLTATATGTSPAYRWYKDGVLISGATSDTYTTTTAGNSYAVIGNSCNIVTSIVATVNVNSAAVITTQPSNVAVCVGGSASFSVNATGTNLSYQWYDANGAINGATSSILSFSNIQAASAGTYSVVVTGTCNNVSSNTVNLTVNEAIVLTAQPTSVAICAPNFFNSCSLWFNLALVSIGNLVSFCDSIPLILCSSFT